MRKTHRAMNLMRLLSDYSDGFSNSRLPGRNLYNESVSYTHLTLPTILRV